MNIQVNEKSNARPFLQRLFLHPFAIPFPRCPGSDHGPLEDLGDKVGPHFTRAHWGGARKGSLGEGRRKRGWGDPHSILARPTISPRAALMDHHNMVTVCNIPSLIK